MQHLMAMAIPKMLNVDNTLFFNKLTNGDQQIVFKHTLVGLGLTSIRRICRLMLHCSAKKCATLGYGVLNAVYQFAGE